MRRLWSIATFVLLLVSIPVAAQHGGGHAGGGHAGFSGGHSGFSGGHAAGRVGGFAGRSGFSGSRAAGAIRPNRGFSNRGLSSPRISNPGLSRDSVRAPFRAGSSHGPFLHNGSRGVRFRTIPSRSRCFGFPCRGYLSYPWGYAGFYDPYWWWDSGSSSYDEDYERDQAIANDMNQQSLEAQQMRDQDQDQDEDQNQQYDNQRDPYARMSPSPAPPQPEPDQPATLLVFRDQHKQEIRNYAIVGQTLWNFAPERTQKIPLSDLDLTATTKANDERGLTFRVPSPGEAQ